MTAISSIGATSLSATEQAALLLQEQQQQAQVARTTATAAAAKSLNMSTTDLQQQLQSGTPLKAVAASKGVDFATVQSAITAAVTPQLSQAVQSGDMTSQQSQNLLSRLTSGDAPGAVKGKGHHHGHHGGAAIAAASTVGAATTTSAASQELALLTSPSYSSTGSTASTSSAAGQLLNQTA